MVTRVFSIVLGFFSVCLPVAAQQANRFETGTIALEPWRQLGDFPFVLALYQPNILSMIDGSMLSLGEPRLPVANLSAGQGRKLSASPTDRASSSAGVFTLRLDPQYSGGEIGVLYGRGNMEARPCSHILSAPLVMKNSRSPLARLTRNRASAFRARPYSFVHNSFRRLRLSKNWTDGPRIALIVRAAPILP